MHDDLRGEYTTPHMKALVIMQSNGVRFLSEQVVHTGRLDGNGREYTYKVDAIVTDDRYSGPGILHVDGASHRGRKARKDEIEDAILTSMGYWSVRVPNNDVANVMGYLSIASIAHGLNSAGGARG